MVPRKTAIASPQDGRLSGRLSRRAFVRDGVLWLAAPFSAQGAAFLAAAEGTDKPKLRLGLVTDLHYADKAPRGTRHYRETLAKFAEAAGRFAEDQPDLVVELGDLIDSADSIEAEKDHLRRVAKALAATPGQHHYVLGNHCVDTLTKPEFLDLVGQQSSFYSFDAKGFHAVVLDACFRADGQPYGRKNFHWTDANVPPAELQWLRADLAQGSSKTIVFVHQRLDVEPPVGVKNAPEVRKILEASGRVLAVLQGHHHRNDYREIEGVPYCTLHAMVEGSGAPNNAYATMDVFPSGAIRITGFRQQKSYTWRQSDRA